ncbi:hypothetical protein [Spiroplasma alleghenense]|uniref:Transmembrane protein n=1 Tax=Spiroplasma alleghenense TaxID=216931 RepID=A0A345Z2I5_9MOLU|nr:hypothetical protein [Spiroplasma alleghenense]AXK50814.1 hypothetical protein SALLE_v1c01380 [Spiroplasma alleghenense]
MKKIILLTSFLLCATPAINLSKFRLENKQDTILLNKGYGELKDAIDLIFQQIVENDVKFQNEKIAKIAKDSINQVYDNIKGLNLDIEEIPKYLLESNEDFRNNYTEIFNNIEKLPKQNYENIKYLRSSSDYDELLETLKNNRPVIVGMIAAASVVGAGLGIAGIWSFGATLHYAGAAAATAIGMGKFLVDLDKSINLLENGEMTKKEGALIIINGAINTVTTVLGAASILYNPATAGLVIMKSLGYLIGKFI